MQQTLAHRRQALNKKRILDDGSQQRISKIFTLKHCQNGILEYKSKENDKTKQSHHNRQQDLANLSQRI